MVKQTRWGLLFWLLPVQAAPSSLQLSPVVCTTDQAGECEVVIDVRWQSPAPMCLRRQDTFELLICARAGEWQFELQIAQDVQLEWLQQSDQQVVERRQIKLLRTIAEDHPLHSRRLSWSLF